MVMMPQPIGSAIDALDPEHKARRIFMSPRGATFKQQEVFRLLNYDHILLLCGHYEGVDQRVLDMYIDEEISIGDYVLTGGELPAMVVCDSVARYVDGVISDGSLVDESFSDGMLEYPQFTRPAVYKGVSVPDVLLSGNHAKIDEWRKEESKKITLARRPDLLDGEK
jgi:tRNA (guanine37-N1)-methyltransferase